MDPVNHARWFPAVLVLTLLAASEPTLAGTTFVKAYAGPPLPEDKVALVAAGSVSILSVDGTHIPTAGGELHPHPSWVELAPGAHTLRVFYFGSALYALGAPKLAANFEAGHLYSIAANLSPREGLWDPRLADITASENDKKLVAEARKAAEEYRRGSRPRLVSMGGRGALVDRGRFLLSVDGAAVPFTPKVWAYKLSPGTHTIVVGTRTKTNAPALQYLNGYVPVTLTITIDQDHVYYLTSTEDFMKSDPWNPKVVDITDTMDGISERFVEALNGFLQH